MLTNDAVQAAAELGRREAHAAPATPYELDPQSAVVVRTIRNDESIQTVSLEYLLDRPKRPRGTVTLHDPGDFAAYVARQESADTTIFADQDALAVTAVFNDHTRDEAGWRDHAAVLQIQRDPDWQTWLTRDGLLSSQAEFAEHLENQAHVIIEPDAATMLEVATSFDARRHASFSRAVRLESGDVQLSWSEETSASAGTSGRLDVPRQFTLGLAPFVGVDPVEVVALLRYRIKDGRLGIGYKLLRPDHADRAAFTDIRAMIANEVTAPVLAGAAPRAVAAR
jgi:uncharacterized protein YfdQ (DUF2303 family)